MLNYAYDFKESEGFGELSFLTNEKVRGMTVVAKDDLYVAAIPEETF